MLGLSPKLESLGHERNHERNKYPYFESTHGTINRKVQLLLSKRSKR